MLDPRSVRDLPTTREERLALFDAEYAAATLARSEEQDEVERKDEPKRNRASRQVTDEVTSCQKLVSRSLPKISSVLRFLLVAVAASLEGVEKIADGSVGVGAEVGASGGAAVANGQGLISIAVGMPAPAAVITTYTRLVFEFLLNLLEESRSNYASCIDRLQTQNLQIEQMLSACSPGSGFLLDEDMREYLHVFVRGLQHAADLEGWDTSRSVQSSARARRQLERGQLRPGFQSYCQAYRSLLSSNCEETRRNGQCVSR